MWHEAAAVARRYPVATFAPSILLGAVSAGAQLLVIPLPGVYAISVLVTAITFNLYLAYAEKLMEEASAGPRRIHPRRVMRLHGRAGRDVPAIVVASVLTPALSFSALGLLMIPGLWLLTRWAVVVPVISNQGVGPITALRRSNRLVRGSSWGVLRTATLALVIDEAVVHGLASVGREWVLEGRWGAFVLGGIAAALVVPITALTVSAVFTRLERREAGLSLRRGAATDRAPLRRGPDGEGGI